MGGWLILIRDFTSFSNVFLVASGRWVGDNERLCAMEPRELFNKFPPPACLEPGNARSAVRR